MRTIISRSPKPVDRFGKSTMAGTGLPRLTTPNSTNPSRLEIWWWTSVPFLLVFAALVLILKPTPGILAHILFPLLISFWAVLYSSLAWIVVTCFQILWRMVSVIRGVPGGESSRVTFGGLLRLILGIAACLLGVYLEFFWAGNMGG